MTTPLPSIFIGSSSQGLAVAREVELQLQTVALVSLWANGVFVLGEGTLEGLINALDNFDFALMVLSPDDLLATGGQNYASPRDNVLFELGLFMGRIGRKRTFILSEEGVDLKLPSDLAGITRATYQKHSQQKLSDAVSPACTKIIQAIGAQGTLERDKQSGEFKKFLELGIDRLHYPLTDEHLRKSLASSKEIAVLKTWFPENPEIERGLLDAISQQASVRLLLCKPESTILRQRSLGAHKPAWWGSFMVYQAVENVYNCLQATPGADVKIALYDSWPGCPVIWYGQTILVGFYFRGNASPAWPWVSVDPTLELAGILKKQFDELWTLSEPKHPDTATEHLDTPEQMADWLDRNRKWANLAATDVAAPVNPKQSPES